MRRVLRASVETTESIVGAVLRMFLLRWGALMREGMCDVPSLFRGKTTVDLHGIWNPREDGCVQWLKGTINQVGLADARSIEIIRQTKHSLLSKRPTAIQCNRYVRPQVRVGARSGSRKALASLFKPIVMPPTPTSHPTLPS